MKRIQFSRYGDASVMQVGEFEPPEPGPQELRIRVVCAALNPLDWKQRQGLMKPFMSRRFPKGMGSDFAGVVETVGAQVTGFAMGDDVFGTMGPLAPGAFAQVVVVDAANVVHKPANLSFAAAACLPIPAMTAWAALVHRGRIGQRRRVFIAGCTGAVGTMAVQLARMHGARIAGSCNREATAAARQAGVDPVFDYSDRATRPDRASWDIVFDTAGRMDVGEGLSMLAPGGVFVDINPGPRRVLRGLLGLRYRLAFASQAMKELASLGELAARGVLVPRIGLERPFADGVATLAAVEGGLRTDGRVVLAFYP